MKYDPVLLASFVVLSDSTYCNIGYASLELRRYVMNSHDNINVMQYIRNPDYIGICT